MNYSLLLTCFDACRSQEYCGLRASWRAQQAAALAALPSTRPPCWSCCCRTTSTGALEAPQLAPQVQHGELQPQQHQSQHHHHQRQQHQNRVQQHQMHMQQQQALDRALPLLFQHAQAAGAQAALPMCVSQVQQQQQQQ